ncbi:uncharacterized protein LOC119601323 [Lucilia sericata]|nr:uncharacterized protein LOC119601323 [Lucilia sericata]
MSFRILTPLTTNRMSRLIFITLLSVLILTPESIQAARRSRLDLTAANVSASDVAAAAATSTNSNNDSETLKTASAPQVSLDNASSALPLKTDQSSLASDTSAGSGDNAAIVKDTIALPAVVDTGKSAASDLIAEEEKQPADAELPKEQKETPTASFEDVEVVDSATQLGASGNGGSSSQSHEECDSDMMGFEIVTG